MSTIFISIPGSITLLIRLFNVSIWWTVVARSGEPLRPIQRSVKVVYSWTRNAKLKWGTSDRLPGFLPKTSWTLSTIYSSRRGLPISRLSRTLHVSLNYAYYPLLGHGNFLRYRLVVRTLSFFNSRGTRAFDLLSPFSQSTKYMIPFFIRYNRTLNSEKASWFQLEHH